MTALNSAYHIALEAGRLHQSYCYPERSASGFRGYDGAKDFFKKKTPRDREALIGTWAERMNSGSKLADGVMAWCKDTGMKLLTEFPRGERPRPSE